MAPDNNLAREGGRQAEGLSAAGFSPPHGSRRNTTANRLDEADRPAHDWYRFVLSFPPHLVRDYLARFELRADSLVLDPYCGTGTTVVECKKQGIPSLGIEAHPMAHFASSVKTDWSADAAGLLAHAGNVAETARRAGGAQEAASLQANGVGALLTAPQSLRGLLPDIQKLLLTGSISPLPLHRTLALLEAMQTHEHPQFTPYERLALAKAMVAQIGNLEFGPEVGVGPAKEDAPVGEAWLAAVETMSADLCTLADRAHVPATVIHADAREAVRRLPAQSVDAVITSPPYPNEKDYTRTSRLETVLLGFVQSKEELRRLKRTLVRSNTRGVYKEDDDDRWVARHAGIQGIAAEIERRRIELGKTSGFERLYARVTRLYFGGMYRHLAELRHALKPGARLAYVVGDQASYLRVMIRTGQILAELAQELGYEVQSIDLFRTRLATATREQLREEVLILRWPGTAGA